MRKLVFGLAAATVLAFGGGAQAAIVAIGGTGSAGAGGFTLVSPGVSTDTGNPAYFNGQTIVGGQEIASDWVWPQVEGGFADSAEYVFEFDLSGFDPTSATLEGLWGVDNIGAVSLNGNLLDSLPNVDLANFNILHAFSTTIDLYFNPTVNFLRFTLSNGEGAGFNPAAFRAAVRVTADAISEVPLPGALPLFAAGIAAFAFARGRRRTV